jgi:uncharacterized protein YbjT (DUF2867 family)
MILVTGATGKIGRELVRELGRIGAPFRMGSRNSDGDGRDAVLFDFDRPETFGKALSGIEKLFLLTSGGTEREIGAVEAAKKAGVRRLVKLSVWGAGDDAFVIGRAHRAVERDIERTGISWTFLRPNGFMQNLTTYKAAGIRDRGVIADATGHARWSIVDARDVAAVAARALTEDGHDARVYALSGPEALSQPEMAERISTAIRRPVRYVDLSDAEYRRIQIENGVPARYADALVDLNVYYRSGAGAPVTADVARALERKPRTFDDFVKENAAAWA